MSEDISKGIDAKVGITPGLATGELKHFVRGLITKGKIGLRHPLVLALFDENERNIFINSLWRIEGKGPEKIAEDHRVVDTIQASDNLHGLNEDELADLRRHMYLAETRDNFFIPSAVPVGPVLLTDSIRAEVALTIEPEKLSRIDLDFTADLDERYAEMNAKKLEAGIPGCTIEIVLGDKDSGAFGVQKLPRGSADRDKYRAELRDRQSTRFGSKVTVHGMPSQLWFANSKNLIGILNNPIELN